MDAALRELVGPARLLEGVALAAVGGYGRGELAPHSDIDLLILHGDEAVDDLAHDLLYPLWDAGFSVGHAVRTAEECLQEAGRRLDSATAMLDARLLSGDRTRFDEMHVALLARLRHDVPKFLEGLREDARDRHRRHGSVSHLLEPDLKEGAGGLRDVHSLRWAAWIAARAPGLQALEEAGVLRRAEREAVEQAEEYLVRLRSALHLETARRADRVVMEQQPWLAAAMGFESEPGLEAIDALMRATFEHARAVEHVVAAVLDRLAAAAAGEEPPIGPGDVDESAEGVLEAFAAVAEGAALTPSVLDGVERVPIPDEVPWTESMRGAFLRILRAGRAGAEALEAMDRAGLLVRFLPEWGPVRCRPQRDPYHRFTVDMHLLQTLAGVARLLSGDSGDDRVAMEAVSLVDQPDGLLLGALLHDIGKTGKGSHVPVGVRVGAAALDRVGFEGPTRDLALFLVEHHLLLADTATRRDLGDENLVLDVVARVGSPGRLAALYLLTVADGVATGPHAWTTWRAGLVRELVAKVQHVLERGDMGAEAAARLEERADAVRGLLAHEDPAAVERFLARMPRSYLVAVRPEEVARHFGLLRAPVGRLEVRTASGPGTRLGTYLLTVVAADRPGLLARVAGALSLTGLSILTAQVFTTEDGVAVDVFEVVGGFEPEIGEDRWRAFRISLRRALEGRLSLEHRVREKRRHYPPPRVDVPVKVTVDNEASDFFTVIEVGAADRIGLLFDITRTLAQLELDVHLAKVATYGERVVDVFYVRDALGRKVDDPGLRAEIERALRAGLAEDR